MADQYENYTRQQLISAIIEMQTAIKEFESRVDKVKEESAKLQQENITLTRYVASLQEKIAVVHSTSPFCFS